MSAEENELERMRAEGEAISAEIYRRARAMQGPLNWADAARRFEVRLAEARAALREVEWQGDDFGERCASCGGRDLPDDERSVAWAKTLQSHIGHAPDCRLAKVLEGEK